MEDPVSAAGNRRVEKLLNQAKDYSPQVREYLARLKARPAFIKAVDLGDAEPIMREVKHAFD